MPAEKTDWLVVLCLWGAGLGAAAQYGKISVIFDQLALVYPEAGARLGLVVSLVGFVGILFGVAAAILVARIRYRRALLWALWAGAFVSLAQGFLPPFGWMLASRVVEGVSHLAIVVAAPTLIVQITRPQDRGLVLTLWGTFFGVAFALLAWVGLPLVAVGGVSALFGVHALYMAAFAVLLACRLHPLADHSATVDLSAAKILRDHLTIYRSPAISAPAAGWLFYTFCFVSILTLLPPFIAPEQRAFTMAAMPLTSIAVSMTLGVFLLRVLSAVQVIQLGFALSALAMFWLWISPGLPLACLFLAAAMGLIQGASFAAVPQLNTTPETQAQANGAMAQMGNIGNTLGTPLMAFAMVGMGYVGLLVLAGLAFGLGLLIHAVLARARRSP